MRNILQSNLCCVCLHGYTYEKYPTFLPCGHIVCEACSKQITICPVDRKPFLHKNVKKVYNNASEETDDQKVQGIMDFLANLVTSKNELTTENQSLVTNQSLFEKHVSKLQQEHETAYRELRCLHQDENQQNAELYSELATELDQQTEQQECLEETITLLEKQLDKSKAESKQHKSSAQGAVRRVAELVEQSKRLVSKSTQDVYLSTKYKVEKMRRISCKQHV